MRPEAPRACAPFRPLLSPYADGMLAAGEQEALEAHLAGCRFCPEELRLLRTASSAAASLPRVRAPAGFAARVGARIRAEAVARPAPRASWLSALWSRPLVPGMAAAGAAAVLGVVVALNVTRSPEPVTIAPGVVTREVESRALPPADAPVAAAPESRAAARVPPRLRHERAAPRAARARRAEGPRMQDRPPEPEAFERAPEGESAELAARSGSRGAALAPSGVEGLAEVVETRQRLLLVPAARFEQAAERIEDLSPFARAPAAREKSGARDRPEPELRAVYEFEIDAASADRFESELSALGELHGAPRREAGTPAAPEPGGAPGRTAVEEAPAARVAAPAGIREDVPRAAAPARPAAAQPGPATGTASPARRIRYSVSLEAR